MKLITKEIATKLPKLGKTDGQGKAVKVPLKLFNPVGNGTWYIMEMDLESGEMFGLCDLGLGTPELGSVLLSELECLKLPLGMKIERDRYWEGTLADAENELRARGAYL